MHRVFDLSIRRQRQISIRDRTQGHTRRHGHRDTRGVTDRHRDTRGVTDRHRDTRGVTDTGTHPFLIHILEPTRLLSISYAVPCS